MSTKLIVENLPPEITKGDLEDLCAAYGCVQEARLTINDATVTMSTPEEARSAIEGMNGMELCGHVLTAHL